MTDPADALKVKRSETIMRALGVLVADCVISSGRAREIADMTIYEQREFWRREHAETIAVAESKGRREAFEWVVEWCDRCIESASCQVETASVKQLRRFAEGLKYRAEYARDHFAAMAKEKA